LTAPSETPFKRSMADCDALIIGAGCVGLAIGRALALAGLSVIVVERNASFGEETSSRNSEVIHAGLYYPPSSLKAKLCVEGRRGLYAYCAARGIRADPLGKLILAAREDEIPALERLMAWGKENGVEDLSWVSSEGLSQMEPALRAVKALHSPHSGLFDSHGYMLALLGEIEDHGGAVVMRTPFLGASPVQRLGGYRVRLGGVEPTSIHARALILAAGLASEPVAHSVQGLSPVHIPAVRFAKGSYFRYAGKAPFSRLIYPAPTPAGHGVHYSIDPNGQAKFGPDVEMVPAINYQVDASRRVQFAAGIRRYWPGLEEDRLQPDYAGVRPKIGAAPKAFEDFRILGPDRHGQAGLYCLFGIDSPGLTASLALGEHLAAMVRL
jgi:L-2-hydroxyglutarate oxidase LhgO